jgi:hypothetical protein
MQTCQSLFPSVLTINAPYCSSRRECSVQCTAIGTSSCPSPRLTDEVIPKRAKILISFADIPRLTPLESPPQLPDPSKYVTQCVEIYERATIPKIIREKRRRLMVRRWEFQFYQTGYVASATRGNIYLFPHKPVLMLMIPNPGTARPFCSSSFGPQFVSSVLYSISSDRCREEPIGTTVQRRRGEAVV